eukprot:555067-Prorocentrum_lima.AAC.1
MTSSLVGSEMCIRDRHGAGIGRIAELDNTDRNDNLVPNSICRSAKTPVSYTHLTLPTICSV